MIDLLDRAVRLDVEVPRVAIVDAVFQGRGHGPGVGGKPQRRRVGDDFRVGRILGGIEPTAAPALEQIVDAVDRPTPIVAGNQDFGPGTAAHGDRVAVITLGRRRQSGLVVVGQIAA